MIKKILEQNGYEWFFDFGYESTRIAKLKINGTTVYEYKFADLGTLETKKYLEEMDKIYEFASRQYVKENGFKHSWFDNFDEHIDNFIEETIQRLCATLSDDDDKTILKLLCWLYANDIKIVED